MESSVWLMLLLQLILIALNAVFACAEIAVISMNDVKLAKLAEEGDKRAVKLARLTSQPARFLATIQIAITLSGFLGSAFASENFSDVLVDALLALGVPIPAATLNTIAVIVITVVLSYITLIFGELVPKRIAMHKAEALALGLASLMSAIAGLCAPVVWLLTNSTNAILRLIGIDPNAEDEEISEESIRIMVDAGSEKGAIDHEEKQFIQNVFEFDDLTAGDIATHRTDVVFLRMEEGMDKWKDTIYGSRHTRYPVCGESRDDVIGILDARDYFRLEDKNDRAAVLKNAVKPAYFVPDNVKADILFRNMRQNHHQFAVVLDEYSGLDGILTVNDLIEQLVGDLGEEEAGPDTLPPITRIDSTTWQVNGSASLEELSEELGISVEDGDSDTLNGLIFGALGTVPADGSQFELQVGRLSIQVHDIREHQVEGAVIRLMPEQQAETDSEN